MPCLYHKGRGNKDWPKGLTIKSINLFSVRFHPFVFSNAGFQLMHNFVYEVGLAFSLTCSLFIGVFSSFGHSPYVFCI